MIRIISSMNKSLKIGLILDNLYVSKYVVDLIRWSKSNSGIEISHYLVPKNQNPNNAKKSKFQKIFSLNAWKTLPRRRLKNFILKTEKNRNLKHNRIHHDSMQKYKIDKEGLDKIEYEEIESKSNLSFIVAEESLKAIKDLDFDILLRFNKKIIRGELLNITKYGIISMHHGSDFNYRGGPAGFWEVYNGDPKSGYIIQKLTEKLDNGNILFRGFIPTQRSWLLNKAELNLRSFHNLKKILVEISNKKQLPNFLDNYPFPFLLNTDPTIFQMFQYIFKKYKNRKDLKKFKNANNRYLVGFQNTDWGNLEYRKATYIKNPKNTFLADPFVIEVENQHYCFLEAYDYEKDKGTIDVYRLDNSDYQKVGTAIEEDFHLSFPYLLKHNGTLYMIPESSKNKDIRLYKCIEFPLKWELEKVLKDSIDASDTMVFYHNNLWWMMTNVDELFLGDHNYQLNIYYSEDLLSDAWKPHKKNPILMDPAYGRNAGLLIKDKNLFRVAQKYGFNKKYGEGISIRQISNLSEDSYHEIELASYESFYSNKILGSHHLHSNNKYTVFDVWKATKQ